MTDSSNITTGQNETSWRNNYLKELLQTKTVRVVFLKKDGSERSMLCTLRSDVLPQQTDLEEAVQKKTPNPDVLAVWDVESNGWRSFRYDSIIGFTEEVV
jgi:hypothetical protein